MAAPIPTEMIPIVLDFLFDSNDLLMTPDTHIDIKYHALCLANSLMRRDRPRCLGYVQNVIPNYTLDDFRSIFRVSRGMFEELLTMCGPELSARHPDGAGRIAISVEKTALVSLYYMGCQETVRKIAEKFELCEFSVMTARDRFNKALLAKKKDLIKWPKGNRAHDVIEGFSAKRGLKAIGAVDGSHIPVRPPSNSPEIYVNRKGFHSILLQAVCDHEMFITDVYAGWPGSVHDARVFRRSPLCEHLENHYEQMCPEGSYVLGDAAYPLKHSLLTPFKDNGHLTQHQKDYNFKHSSTRMKIEHTFGVLKGRWRRLKLIDIVNLQTVLDVIVVACLLHNLCLLHEEDLEEYMGVEGQDVVNEFENLPLFRNTPTGIAKRLEVMEEICQ